MLDARESKRHELNLLSFWKNASSSEYSKGCLILVLWITKLQNPGETEINRTFISSEVCAVWHDWRHVCPYEQHSNVLWVAFSYKPLIICTEHGMSTAQFSKEPYVKYASSYLHLSPWGEVSMRKSICLSSLTSQFSKQCDVQHSANCEANPKKCCYLNRQNTGVDFSCLSGEKASTVLLNLARAQLLC